MTIVWAEGPQVNQRRQDAAKKAILSGKLPSAPVNAGPPTPRITTVSHRPRKLPLLDIAPDPDNKEQCLALVGRDIGGCLVKSSDGIVAVVEPHASIAWIPLTTDSIAWEDAYAPVHKSVGEGGYSGVVWSWERGRTVWTTENREDGIKSRGWITSPNGEECRAYVASPRVWAWRGADAWSVAGPQINGESQYLLLRFPHGAVLVSTLRRT